jgi:hypothetical protein
VDRVARRAHVVVIEIKLIEHIQALVEQARHPHTQPVLHAHDGCLSRQFLNWWSTLIATPATR